ncbi:MAG: ACT domain-containing protein [Thermodesulfobacteriota bacterium]|nr:ACT domain-containing protein [Thermodesulfobacteriota bacterium]
MRVEQISIFLENKAGRLAEVTRVLSETGVNIRALSLADTSDFGILRLIVDDNEKAKKALKEHGFTVGKTDVVAVEVEDRPGGLSQILDVLSKKSINVEYMYAFVQHSGKDAVIIFRFDDIDAAVKLLQENNVRVLEGKTVYTL